ncbi:hypothetical protein MBLNU459_g6843t1 [Dothideomycetes sp. NU459]
MTKYGSFPTPPSDPQSTHNSYIHGGAWRDPSITSRSILSAQTDLLSSRPHGRRIAGLASLNYRLSPYPSHPTSPSSPADAARNAVHPDHIDDVGAALRHLQARFGFGRRYVLAGHSCGATLALQTVLAAEAEKEEGEEEEEEEGEEVSSRGVAAGLQPPSAVVAIEGIYDVPGLVAAHAGSPYGHIYAEFVRAAFGSDERVWRDASPALRPLRSGWGGSGAGALVVLAHSREDELVEWEQVEGMRGALLEQGWREGGAGESGGKEVLFVELSGKHDEIWEEGREAARAIGVAIEKMMSSAAV